MKLGFFTKKGYIIYLFYNLFVDYIYVLVFGKEKLEILIFGLPYTITVFIFFHIVFIGGFYLLSKVKSLFGIDFLDNIQDHDSPAPLLAPLFTEKGFSKFQQYSSNHFNKKRITIGAGIIAILITFLGIWTPFLFFQGDEWIDNFPELAENGLYNLYLLFRIVPYSLSALWFLFSVSALLILIIELMLIFNALGNFSGLSLSKISEYYDKSVEKAKSGDNSEDLDVVQFSLRRFRKKCRVIPEMFLRLNIVIALATFIVGIMISIYTSYILQEDVRNYSFSFFFLFLSGIMLFNFIVFIFPQYSLHRHLESVKGSFLEKFDEIYVIKKFQYLDFALKEKSEEKNFLLNELQTIHQIIGDIEEISTWPFNYNHLVTLSIGLIFPFLPLIVEILFIFQR
jgi:hypothetical protein